MISQLCLFNPISFTFESLHISLKNNMNHEPISKKTASCFPFRSQSLTESKSSCLYNCGTTWAIENTKKDVQKRNQICCHARLSKPSRQLTLCRVVVGLSRRRLSWNNISPRTGNRILKFKLRKANPKNGTSALLHKQTWRPSLVVRLSAWYSPRSYKTNTWGPHSLDLP